MQRQTLTSDSSHTIISPFNNRLLNLWNVKLLCTYPPIHSHKVLIVMTRLWILEEHSMNVNNPGMTKLNSSSNKLHSSFKIIPHAMKLLIAVTNHSSNYETENKQWGCAAPVLSYTAIHSLKISLAQVLTLCILLALTMIFIHCSAFSPSLIFSLHLLYLCLPVCLYSRL